MTNRERLLNVLDFKPVDRMPAIELMPWWNLTRDRWVEDGMTENTELTGHWKLDDHRQIWLRSEDPELHIHRLDEQFPYYIRDEEDYDRILPFLYPGDAVLDNWAEDELRGLKARHDAGDAVVWMTILGYFWWPRVLFGIQPHLYSFYEYPELYHRICNDQMEFHLKVIEDFCSILEPDFMSFAEDMSYNHGPMISKAMFDEFIKPHYDIVIPALHKHGVKVFVDTDGDMTMMVQWMLDCGVDGILPVERRAGVDICGLREKYPGLLMLGGFDKTLMSKGEDAMRKEFERIAPVMKSGGFIPSVDHQTPPDVSIANYRIYRRLQDEYCAKYHP